MCSASTSASTLSSRTPTPCWRTSSGPLKSATSRATRLTAAWCSNSWNGYFDTLYARAIELAEEQRGEGSKLTTSEVDVLQTKAKKVLDLLCRASKRWVAITEHAVPQGQELDPNEAGQLIIMTIGGTDYYSDVTFDLSMVLGDDFRARRIATVTKSNVDHLYGLGRKIESLTFKQLVDEVNGQAPIKQIEAPAAPVQEARHEPAEAALTLDDLLAKADEYGIAEAHMSKAAARYCHGKRLDQLDAGEIATLYARLVASREGEEAEQAGRADEYSADRLHVVAPRTSTEDAQDEWEPDVEEEQVAAVRPGSARSNGRAKA